ncbi:hypothetical protein HYH02_006288 [Chlamydomonas schloesseri]|uniref:Uncharacterized protein n=1 Tax=Chlamydomonas schloesseri TaxID=2026947 RepID=A0A835WJT6_9CHLO|nr:hypothetical protein HYH02_006288 [Chlamydomonas schloesseri]|eukprot:KAG2448396.1 hypothetical protein HYH02_006288 [Chlamydomonas schloesseri]
MSQAQEPTASQNQSQQPNVTGSQQQQPTDAPKVLAGGNVDPTNPLAGGHSGLENPEAQKKAEDMGATIPSQGPPPEISNEPAETASGGTQSGTQSGAGGPTEGTTATAPTETAQETGTQPAPGSQA